MLTIVDSFGKSVHSDENGELEWRKAFSLAAILSQRSIQCVGGWVGSHAFTQRLECVDNIKDCIYFEMLYSQMKLLLSCRTLQRCPKISFCTSTTSRASKC